MYKISSYTINKNKKTWQINLVPFEKAKAKRTVINKIIEPLDKLIRIPNALVVLGRFTYLASLEKSVFGRCKVIACELIPLWTKLNFPAITEKSV